MVYDDTNVFAKILRDEIACKKIYENDYVLSFHDISPVASVHAIVIPKGKYIDYADFISKASDLEKSKFFASVYDIITLLNLSTGYRLLSNSGKENGQTVFHFHMHIISGPLLKPFA